MQKRTNSLNLLSRFNYLTTWSPWTVGWFYGLSKLTDDFIDLSSKPTIFGSYFSHASNDVAVIRDPKNRRCAKIITTGQILHWQGLPWYRGDDQMVSVILPDISKCHVFSINHNSDKFILRCSIKGNLVYVRRNNNLHNMHSVCIFALVYCRQKRGKHMVLGFYGGPFRTVCHSVYFHDKKQFI